MRRRGLAAAIASLTLIACAGMGAGGPSDGRPPGTSRPTAAASPASARPTRSPATGLTIYAAASLKGALERAETAYRAAHPDVGLVVALDSSATLETQIEQGAPADLFLSADATNPKKLVDQGLADAAPVTFAGNRLTIIVPTSNPAGITSPKDLARTGVKVIAAGAEVPITTYAAQLVDRLAHEPGYPTDFAAGYAGNIASREDNVKAIVAKIALGEGDAGIVYVTDANASDAVTTIDVPLAAEVPATYEGVVVKGSRDPAAAQAFLDWLAGPDGQAILGELGFLPPP